MGNMHPKELMIRVPLGCCLITRLLLRRKCCSLPVGPGTSISCMSIHVWCRYQGHSGFYLCSSIGPRDNGQKYLRNGHDILQKMGTKTRGKGIPAYPFCIV